MTKKRKLEPWPEKAAFGEMQPLIVVYAFVFKPDSSENTFTKSPLGDLGDLGVKDCNG